MNNFEQPNLRLDKGEFWENTCFRSLADHYGADQINFWRTADGNEVDFIVEKNGGKLAIDAKYSKEQIKLSKYKKFNQTYPEIKLSFLWFDPFDERFFTRSG